MTMLWAALAAPLPADTWSSFATYLAHPVRAGSKELVVSDCRQIEVGGRVRIDFANEEEEEGSVVGVECAAGRHVADAAALAQAAAECDVATLVSLDDGAVARLPERCRIMVQAALRVPGVAASYRTAARSSMRGVAALSSADPAPAVRSQQQQQQQQHQQRALMPDATMPPVSRPFGVRGAATALLSVEESRAGAKYPGVVTLAAGLLFAHSANVTVRGTAALLSIEAATCPMDLAGRTCSGRGACEANGDSCTCDPGAYGPLCEHDACAAGCSDHGSCHGVGNCVCHAGWTGEACSEVACPMHCNSRGSCLSGRCACAAGFSGSDCSTPTAAACPDSCGGHGNCAVVGNAAPVCLCHANFVGVSCMTAAPMSSCSGLAGCNGHGTCDVDPVTNTPQCLCYPGYSGADCGVVCPNNCTIRASILGSVAQGRCTSTFQTGSSTQLQCICKEGFSGPHCEQECPSRCNGHGDCVNGECTCRAGYTGARCEDLMPRQAYIVFMEGIQGFSPVLLLTFIALCGLVCFCCTGYSFNRWRGRFGTSAIPMWDFFAKRWRNAPLFEPIFAVPAATQTPALPKS